MVVNQGVWWGDFELEKGEVARWKVGPATVWIQRLGNEWLMYREQDEDPIRMAAEAACPVEGDELPPEEVQSDPAARFSFHRTNEKIHVGPAAADRPVVARPHEPFYVSAGEQITLFLSTPVWIRIESQDPRTLLCEFPSYRMSDTWFGPSTLEGELCYAILTKARMHIEDMTRRPSRIITPLTVRSKSSVPVLVERIRVPLASLPLFASEDGALWTPAVTFELDASGTRIKFDVENRPPAIEPDAKLLAPPRTPGSGISVVKTIGHFFHKFSEKIEDGSVLDRLG